MTSTPGSKLTCSPRELADSLSECLLLDVRTPAEYRGSHIDGSVPHPLDQFDTRKVKELARGKSACVVICASGRRAALAAGKLRDAGMEGVIVLDGGVQAWEKAGLPLQRGKSVISLERQVRIAAGLLVAAGSLLAWLVHPAWLILPGFVGCGLVFSGITDTCGMGLVLSKMPWNK